MLLASPAAPDAGEALPRAVRMVTMTSVRFLKSTPSDERSRTLYGTPYK
jgi:hypothetical protein